MAAFTISVEVALDDDTRNFLANLVRPLRVGISRLEQQMSEISDALTADAAKVDTLVTAVADLAADVTALLAKSTAAGVFSAEEQAQADEVSSKLDALTAAVSGLDVQVGDQDGSDTPPAA